MTLGQHKTDVASLSEQTEQAQQDNEMQEPFKGRISYQDFFLLYFLKTMRKLHESHHIKFFGQQRRKINLMHFNFRRKTKSFNT